jgi:hypothetical protein
VRTLWLRRGALGGSLVLGVLSLLGSAAAESSVLQQVSPLVWAMTAISVGGAAITYAFLVYALWKFRDPSTRRRNYG